MLIIINIFIKLKGREHEFLKIIYDFYYEIDPNLIEERING